MDYKVETIKRKTRATYGCMATGKSHWPWDWAAAQTERRPAFCLWCIASLRWHMRFVAL